MKSVIVHGLLAVFGLSFAYQTWTRKPEEDAAPGSVTAFDCTADNLQNITLVTPTQQVTVEPKRERGELTYWIDLLNKGAEKSKAPNEARPKAAGDMQRRFLANATFTDYLKRLTPMRALRSLGVLPKQKDAEFGFDKIGTYVKVRCGGRNIEFEAGARAFGLSQRYFRESKTKTTYLFSEEVVSDLEAAAFKFLQSELHTFEAADVEEANVEARGAKKRLLHRDRLLADQALWVDANAPAQRNELYNNWFSRVARLKVRSYLAAGAEPGSDLTVKPGTAEPSGAEAVLTIDYKLSGKPAGKLELVRVDQNGVGHYYARSEITHTWVAVYDSSAKEVEQDVGMVVGTESAPKPSAALPASSPAPGSKNEADAHGHGLPPGHPGMPANAPLADPHDPHAPH